MANKESYHACALALSTYTEIMGGLVTGNLREEFGHSKKNYDAFLPYLGQKYVDLDNQIKTKYPDRLKSLYHTIRTKLVHEFSLRESHFLVKAKKPRDHLIGIQLLTDETKTPELIHINFLITEHYRDFKNGVSKYYDELKQGEKYRKLLDNFLKATAENYPSEEPKNNFENHS